MKKETVKLFHALMKKGYIDRRENSQEWNMISDELVKEELEDFKDVIGFDTYTVRDRFYMIPTQDNELFLKNNMDFRKDIKADNTVRLRDLYLINYLAIFVIYLFFKGEGNDPQCREFLTTEDLVREFTEHCNMAAKEQDPEQTVSDYSIDFVNLAKSWAGKMEGNVSSTKMDDRFGAVNRLMNKFKNDELFEVDEERKIRPTRKMKDLMPYFLRKDRIVEIHQWIDEKEELKNAKNQ